MATIGGGEKGPVSDTAAGDVVTVNVSSEGPYGVVLEADNDGNAAVIKGFERLPNGKFGLLQKHGGLHYGDILFAINDIQLDVVPFHEVMVIVRDRNILKKAFKFMNSSEYYRRKKMASTSTLVHDQRNNFMSIIRRTRVQQDGSKKFVEYEIACQLRVVSMRVQKEIVYKWSVWKRYTEFDTLHNNLRVNLGWQLGAIEFPSTHLLVLNKLSPEFIEQRREELNTYWQRVISLDKIAEFNKHHCSEDIKTFLDVEGIMRNSGRGLPEHQAIEEEETSQVTRPQSVGASGSSSGANARRSKALSARRRSSGGFAVGGDLFGSADNVTKVAQIADARPAVSSAASSSSLSATKTTGSAPPPPPPPPPPPRPASVARTTPPPPPPPPAAPQSCLQAASSGPAASLPPKASGARANLLSDIARRRIE